MQTACILATYLQHLARFSHPGESAAATQADTPHPRAAGKRGRGKGKGGAPPPLSSSMPAPAPTPAPMQEPVPGPGPGQDQGGAAGEEVDAEVELRAWNQEAKMVRVVFHPDVAFGALVPLQLRAVAPWRR